MPDHVDDAVSRPHPSKACCVGEQSELSYLERSFAQLVLLSQEAREARHDPLLYWFR